MALKTKITYQSIDKGGSIIKLVDSTGAYSVDNPTGYGFPNTSVADISKIIFTISQFSSTDIYKQTYVRVADPLFPEFKLTPTINQITSGTPIEVSSIDLNQVSIYVPFEDGVFDINMYSVLSTAKTDVVAAVGTPFVLGTGLDTYMQYDSLLIGNKVYDIDKTKGTNGGTIIYLVQELLDTNSLFFPIYRANTKIINTNSTITCLYNKVGKLATGCDESKRLKDGLFDIQLYQWAAKYAFDNIDYVEANKLILSANKLCKHLNCGC